MKRFLKLVFWMALWVVALVAVYDFVNVRLMRASSANSAAKMERLFEGMSNEEVAIFGSSRALGNYYPAALSTNAFNYGCNGMGLSEALMLVENWLKSHQKGTIVINLDPWGFDDPDKARFVGDYRLAMKDARVRKLLGKDRCRLSDWLPGLRFQGQLRTTLVDFINTRRSITKRVDRGAELLLNRRSPEEWKVINRTIEGGEFDFAFCDVNQRQLDQIYALRGNVKICWVVSPAAQACVELFRGRDKLKEFLRRQQDRDGVWGFSWLDKTSDFSDEQFVDPRHLNIRGAEKFSSELAKLISDL